MNFDLFFLSTRIATLVLAGSVLAALLGWLLRSWMASMERAHLSAKLDAEHALRARLQEQMDQSKSTAEKSTAQDKASEEQCLAALQQRDEAERQTLDALNRVRALQEQLERAKREADETEALRIRVTSLETSLAEAREELQQAVERATKQETSVQSPVGGEASETKFEEPVPQIRPLKLFAAPAVTLVAAEMPADDFTEFPPAPERPIEDIARHRSPLREGPRPDVEKMRQLVAELAGDIEKAKPGPKKEVLEARAVYLARNLERMGAAVSDPDDLTEIRGIKAGIQKQLLEIGVCTFGQVAGWTPSELEVIMNLPGIKQRPVKDRWQEQAKELIEIKKWQREK